MQRERERERWPSSSWRLWGRQEPTASSRQGTMTNRACTLLVNLDIWRCGAQRDTRNPLNEVERIKREAEESSLRSNKFPRKRA
eukprot:1609113-Amphidinium_carterae.1